MFDLTYEELVRTVHWCLGGPMEDGDICIPKVAADHLTKHGVAPGDFFREGMQTLDTSSASKFSFGMNHRIRPIIRPGFGWRGRLWRAIHTLPEDWMLREQAIAWFLAQMALDAIPSPGLLDPPSSMPLGDWKKLDHRARSRHKTLQNHFNSLFEATVDETTALEEPRR